MANLDVYIIDNILSYLKINEKIFINKKYYKQSKEIINKSLTTISTFYSYNKLRLELSYEYLDNIKIIRNYFNIFYPKTLRYNFIYKCKKAKNYINFNQDVYNFLSNLICNEYEYINNNLDSISLKNTYIKLNKTDSKHINIYFRFIINNLDIRSILILTEDL